MAPSRDEGYSPGVAAWRWVWLVAGCGCGLVSGLDDLRVDDGGVDALVDVVDEPCSTCDASADASVDVAHDASVADAPPDTTSKQGTVACGGKSCSLSSTTPVCCKSGTSSICVASATVCGGVAIACDTPDDCPGKVCCVHTAAGDAGCLVATSVGCEVACIQNQIETPACDDAGECLPNTCKLSTCTLPDYYICAPP